MRFQPANDNDRLEQRLLVYSVAPDAVAQVTALLKPRGRERIYLIERRVPAAAAPLRDIG
jgi:hypothetical protein